jgi:hypothetical protein
VALKTQCGNNSTNLGIALHTNALQTKDCLDGSFTSEVRVGTETLPVTAASSDAAHVHHRAQCDVDTLSAVLLTDGLATVVDELLVPGGGSIDAGRAEKVCEFTDKHYQEEMTYKAETKSATRTPSGES